MPFVMMSGHTQFLLSSTISISANSILSLKSGLTFSSNKIGQIFRKMVEFNEGIRYLTTGQLLRHFRNPDKLLQNLVRLNPVSVWTLYLRQTNSVWAFHTTMRAVL